MHPVLAHVDADWPPAIAAGVHMHTETLQGQPPRYLPGQKQLEGIQQLHASRPGFLCCLQITNTLQGNNSFWPSDQALAGSSKKQGSTVPPNPLGPPSRLQQGPPLRFQEPCRTLARRHSTNGPGDLCCLRSTSPTVLGSLSCRTAAQPPYLSPIGKHLSAEHFPLE